MFFEKKDIEVSSDYGQVVDADVFLNRVQDAIKDKLVFQSNYPSGEKVNLKRAEAFMFELYGLLKNT